MTELEQRVLRLEAIQDIKTLIAEFARGTDRHNDPVVTRRVFSDDAVWESPQYGRYEGLENIVAATSWGGREVIHWSMHFMVSPVIELDSAATRASANWYLWEPMKARHPDGDVADTWFGATYDARLRKINGLQWKIHHLVLDARLLAKVGEPWPGAIDAQQVNAREIG